jgi:type II secretion system protein N
MLRNNKKWILYGLYTAAVVLFFLYYLFPSDAVEAYIVSTVREVRPSADVTIGRVNPAFPPGIKASAVKLSDTGSMEISLDQIEITPALRTLFGADPVLAFQGRGYDGRLAGRLVLGRDRRVKTLHADLAELEIERMAPVQHLSGRRVSGRLSGTIDVEKAGDDFRLTADMAASGVRVSVEIPSVDLKELTFAEANARLTAVRTSDLRIESLTAKGRQVNGSLAGAIRLATPYPKSVLDLAGSIKPHPSFISELGSSLAVFFQGRGGNNTFPFVIKGTIESPEFLLR